MHDDFKRVQSVFTVDSVGSPVGWGRCLVRQFPFYINTDFQKIISRNGESAPCPHKMATCALMMASQFLKGIKMIKYVFMVTGQKCFDSDDKVEEEVFGLFSTQEKAEKVAAKKREETDILNHKIWDYVFVDKVKLDDEV